MLLATWISGVGTRVAVTTTDSKESPGSPLVSARAAPSGTSAAIPSNAVKATFGQLLRRYVAGKNFICDVFKTAPSDDGPMTASGEGIRRLSHCGRSDAGLRTRSLSVATRVFLSLGTPRPFDA